MKTSTARDLSTTLEDETRHHAFRAIGELTAPEAPERQPVPREALARWLAERPGATGRETIVLACADGPAPMPCLAVARFADRVEVLNVDGKTHVLRPEELTRR